MLFESLYVSGYLGLKVRAYIQFFIMIHVICNCDMIMYTIAENLFHNRYPKSRRIGELYGFIGAFGNDCPCL